MSKLHKAVTVLLILLSLAGVLFAMAFLKKEQKRASSRQQEIKKVSQELVPVNEERRSWEKQEEEWQATLKEKQTGRPCILLSFNNMTRELYDTIYNLMDQYGLRGTFLMKNGKRPNWEMERGDEKASGEMIQEMIDSGWDYAVSVGEGGEEETETEYQRDFSDEFGTEVLEAGREEASGETEETPVPEEAEEETVGFLNRLDSALSSITENGYSQPETVFCTPEQYSEVSKEDLQERGFKTVSVIETDDFPAVVNDQEEELWRIEVGEYTESDENLEKTLDKLIANQQSAAILINDVVKISKDNQSQLTMTSFTSLLNYLKELESDRKINVLTYSEYYQYIQLRQQSYEEALTEYAKFREEKEAALEELDAREAKIAGKLKETEE